MIRETFLRAKTNVEGRMLDISVIAEYIQDGDIVELTLVDDQNNTLGSIPVVQDEYWESAAMEWYQVQKELLAL